ncbi:MAG: pyridoxal-phosphate dependent enzyme [archaeon]|nr:pyridoxal-phosphate dependent enzyme [archaeon]
MEEEEDSDTVKTPLFQSQNLERFLGFSNVYLKFEGLNPTGTQKDRISLVHTNLAKKRGYTTITAGTCGNYGTSLAYFARLFGLRAVIYMSNIDYGNRINELLSHGAEVMKVDKSYEEVVKTSMTAAEKNGWYDANPGLRNSKVNYEAYGSIAREIVRELHCAPTAVGVPVGNGTTLAGIYYGFKCMYKEGLIDHIPRIIAGSSAHGNAIISSFKRGLSHIKSISPNQIKETKANGPLVAYRPYDGDAALKAVIESNGFADYSSDREMLQYSKLFKRITGINVLPASTTPIGALKKFVLKEKLRSTYVIILTGRNFF